LKRELSRSNQAQFREQRVHLTAIANARMIGAAKKVKQRKAEPKVHRHTTTNVAEAGNPVSNRKPMLGYWGRAGIKERASKKKTGKKRERMQSGGRSVLKRTLFLKAQAC